MNAHRNVHPIATRRSPKTRCSPLVWIGSSRSIGGISTAVTSRVVIVPTSLVPMDSIVAATGDGPGGTSLRMGPSDRGGLLDRAGRGRVTGQVRGRLGAPGDLELGQDRAT